MNTFITSTLSNTRTASATIVTRLNTHLHRVALAGALLMSSALLFAPQAAHADAYYGAIDHDGTVEAYSTKSYDVTFAGGEYAEVQVTGDGDTDLDVEIEDADGNAIVQDYRVSTDGYVRFYVSRTGHYTINVVNTGSVYNDFEIVIP